MKTSIRRELLIIAVAACICLVHFSAVSSALADGNQKSEESEKATGPLPEFELLRYTYCGDDRDCVKAVNGCCDCANGGEDVAVNKERLLNFRDRFDCVHVPCGEEERTPSCGSGVVTCVNHRCHYIEPDRIKPPK